ncbi:MAG: L,D-transpeptidase [Hyphomicrobium sp.]|nr:L,D-transpeptidase [Hyphomicrobium sp.]
MKSFPMAADPFSRSPTGTELSRRQILVAGAAAVVATSPALAQNGRGDWYIGIIPDDPFDIEVVDILRVPPEFRRQTVRFDGPEPPGTIVVDKERRHLFWIGPDRQAVRYGIAIGRAGTSLVGQSTVGRKAVWPRWTPTESMRSRDPSLPQSMPGGPRNPLGARALYLFENGRDTIYRIHGTNQPWTIGKAASSGCVRMLNQHIFELYASVPVGTRVVVR